MENNPQKDISDDKLVELAGMTIHGNAYQAELTRRLMESIKSFDATTKKYTIALVALAIVQITIVLLQFTFDVFNSNNQIVGLILLCSDLAFMSWVFARIDRNNKS